MEKPINIPHDEWLTFYYKKYGRRFWVVAKQRLLDEGLRGVSRIATDMQYCLFE
jgi:hypothetical protein